MMDKLLNVDNLAIVVLGLWILENKRMMRNYEKQVLRQWEVLQKLREPLMQIRDLLRIRGREEGISYVPED